MVYDVHRLGCTCKGMDMLRLIMIGIGFLCLLLGIVGILTPIPFGIVFLCLSFILLVPTVPGAAGAVQRVRRKSRAFDGIMSSVTNKAPMPYRRILRQTEIGDL